MSKVALGTVNNRLDVGREELANRITAAFSGLGLLEIFPGIGIARACSPTQPLHSVFTPAFCVIAQGSKKVMLGEETFKYDTGHYLIATVDLPIISYVLEGSEEQPYLSFKMDLEPALVADVLLNSGIDLKESGASVKAMDVSPIDNDLLDAVLRIVRLLDKPDEAQMMLPLIKREIVFRLLKGNQAARLAHLFGGGEDRRISKAIENLREHFDRPLRIETVARDLGMSVSGFHHHFKSVTAMSPLQFQKQIRLQEARRLMLGEDLDAASAGFRVGYDDPSYFSRDYKKQFGAPPQRDITRLRNGLEA
ncbi:MAG: AraC family transcriptional regulator [Acidobacteriota bacterium]